MTFLIEMLFGCRHDLGWPRRYYKQGRWQYRQTCTRCGTEVKYEGELR